MVDTNILAHQTNITGIPLTNFTTDSGLNETTTCKFDGCVSEEEYIDTIEEYVFPQPWEWSVVVIYTLTFIVGVTGNSLVCYAVWRNRNMRTVTNIFIVNLAIADLTVIICCLPATLSVDITETWFYGFVLCKIVYFLINVSISVSVLTLSAIAVERWYAICYPLIFKSTKRRAQVIILIIWILSMCIAIPELVVVETIRFFDKTRVNTDLLISCRPGWPKEQQFIQQIVLLIIMYILPLILMGITYTHIAIVLWKGHIPGAIETSQKPMIDGKMTKADEQLESRKKAAKMLITVVIVFAICYFPVHMYNILRYTGVMNNAHNMTVRVTAVVVHWLPYFNSTLNPLIYNFMSAKFRKEFVIACQCCLRMKRGGRIRGRKETVTFGSTTHYIPRNNSHTEQYILSSFHASN